MHLLMSYSYPPGKVMEDDHAVTLTLKPAAAHDFPAAGSGMHMQATCASPKQIEPLEPCSQT